LEYKFNKNDDFKKIIVKFLKEQENNFNFGVSKKTQKIAVKDKEVYSVEEVSILDNEITAISTMNYSDFLLESSRALNITLDTLHKAFLESKIDIDKYLNHSTIRILKEKFNAFLMFNAFTDFEVSYKKISSSIHPTEFTNEDGALKEINPARLRHKF
jgi:type III restriction enzyme